MAINIVLAILVTSLATYVSRFLGVITSEKIKENVQNGNRLLFPVKE